MDSVSNPVWLTVVACGPTGTQSGGGTGGSSGIVVSAGDPGSTVALAGPAATISAKHAPAAAAESAATRLPEIRIPGLRPEVQPLLLSIRGDMIATSLSIYPVRIAAAGGPGTPGD